MRERFGAAAIGVCEEVERPLPSARWNGHDDGVGAMERRREPGIGPRPVEDESSNSGARSAATARRSAPSRSARATAVRRIRRFGAIAEAEEKNSQAHGCGMNRDLVRRGRQGQSAARAIGRRRAPLAPRQSFQAVGRTELSKMQRSSATPSKQRQPMPAYCKTFPSPSPTSIDCGSARALPGADRLGGPGLGATQVGLPDRLV